MKLTDNFSKSEFDSKDGAEMPEDVLDNIKELANNLQALRYFVGVPIKINSGYRSPEHNKKEGGSPKSQHMKGNAADIVIKGYSPQEVKKIIEGLIRIGHMTEGGLSEYVDFVHYDIRGIKARW